MNGNCLDRDEKEDVVINEDKMSKIIEPCSREEALKVASDFFDGDEIAAEVYINKYALTDDDGLVLEPHPDMHHMRLANEMGNATTFFSFLRNFSLNPAGSIRFGLGNDAYKSSLSNCYVLAIEDDSLEAIFDAAKYMARTYSYRGGVGTDISILRPEHAKVSNSAKFSTGAHSFMDLYNLITELIGQRFRRGALMLSMRVDHPDVLRFVRKKFGDITKMTSTNISVKVTDAFMEIVRDRGKVVLYFDTPVERIRKEMDARELWMEIIKCAHASGEPGILFWDRVVEESPSDGYEGYKVIGVNPCSEECLPHAGSCNLCATTLDRFVLDTAEFDFDGFEEAVKMGVLFLDNIVTLNIGRNPLKKQDEVMENERRIGLGPTGLADAMIKLGIKYDSDEGLFFVDKLFRIFRDAAYRASIQLARERGPFPIFDFEKHIRCPFIQRLPEDIREEMREFGLRNMTILTAAPCGSISCMSQTSSGIEPNPYFQHERRLEQAGSAEGDRTKIVFVKIAKDWLLDNGFTKEQISKPDFVAKDHLPDVFIEAHEIDFHRRAEIQGCIQKYIDAGISSTINLPNSASVELVAEVYEELWKNGCKGGTVYRAGSRDDIIKSATKKVAETEDYVVEMDMAEPLPEDRPPIVPAYVAQIPLAGGVQKVYVVVGYVGKRLYEVFVIVGHSGEESHGWSEGMGRLFSKCLQKGMDPADLTSSLRRIRCGSQFRFKLSMKQEKPYMAESIPSAVATVIEHLTGDKSMVELREMQVSGGKLMRCPYCGDISVPVDEGEGCMTCLNCKKEVCT